MGYETLLEQIKTVWNNLRNNLRDKTNDQSKGISGLRVKQRFSMRRM